MGRTKVNVIIHNVWVVLWDKGWTDGGMKDLTPTIRVKNTVFMVSNKHMPLFFMQCVCCEEWKLRTTDNFAAANVGKKGGIKKWFTDGAPGNHSLMNSESHPCNACYTSQLAVKRNTQGSNGFFQVVAGSCGLKWTDVKAKFEDMTHGAVTYLPKKYILARSDHLLSVGVHDLLRQHRSTGERYDQKKHDKSSGLDLAVVNIPQRDRVPDLPTAHTEMNLFVLDDLHTSDEERANKAQVAVADMNRRSAYKKPRQSGVTANRTTDRAMYDRQRNTLHVPRILARMQSDCKKSDRKKVGTTASKKELVGILETQRMRCYFCSMILTLTVMNWTHVSFDRADNEKSHCVSNLRAVCQLHQAAAGTKGTRHYTRAMVMHMVAVTVEPSVVAKRTPEHAAELKKRHDKFVEDGETCAMCAIEVL